MATRRKSGFFFSRSTAPASVMSDLERFVPVGQVTKAHGIKGDIKVFPFFGHPEYFGGFVEVALIGAEKCNKYPLSSCRIAGGLAILHLDGIDGRNEAESFRGYEVWVDELMLPELPDGEMYWHDSGGLRVLTEDGRDLGIVTEKFSNGAHDILVVSGTGREFMIPVRPEFILSKNDDAGELVVSLPPGLLEIND